MVHTTLLKLCIATARLLDHLLFYKISYIQNVRQPVMVTNKLRYQTTCGLI